MTYGNVNVETVTTSTPGGILGAGNASIMKNRIINGAMVIDQRNSGASVTPTSSAYGIDRWVLAITQASKLSMQQNAGSVTPPAGFTNYLGLTSQSAYSISSSDFFILVQVIEGFNVADLGWGTANAKTVTLSFQVYSSLTGTFGGSLENSAENRAYPFTYSIPVANTWTTISITIPGDTAGTWLTNNGAGIKVNFGLGVGSTKSGTAGSWSGNQYLSATGATSVVGTNGATFYITGVQLEVGSSATGFEYRQYGQELALCQRYYEVGYFSQYAYGGSGSGTGQWVNFSVCKRTTPTVALNTTTYIYGIGSGTTTGASVNGVQIYGNATGTGATAWTTSWNATAEL